MPSSRKAEMKPLRVLVAASAALLTLTVSGQVASAEPSSAATASRATGQTVRISSYNVKHSLSAEAAVGDIVELAELSDVVTLQEMASGARRRAVRASLMDCSLCPFEGYLPA